MEYAEGGDLQSISGFSEYEIWHVCKGISEGLKFLHDQNIVHMDIKPHNILFMKDKTVKLADFGFT